MDKFLKIPLAETILTVQRIRVCSHILDIPLSYTVCSHISNLF